MSARGQTPPSEVARGADVLVRDYMAVQPGEAVLVTADTDPDAIVSEQSIWIDGQKIVEDGVLVGPPHLAKLAERLVPKR